MLSAGSLFTGAGLLDLGLHQAGFRHEWMCEADPWRRQLLHARFPGVPVHADVRAVGALTARRVDVIAGGFPCKGASTAGKRTGLDHPETALWREMRRCVGELRPRFVLLENVANLLAIHGGDVWGTVVGDLAALGYDTVWDCVPAAAFGAPHLRDRVFAVGGGPQEPGVGGPLAARDAHQAPAHPDLDARERGVGAGPLWVRGPADASRRREAASDSGHGRREGQPPGDGEEPPHHGTDPDGPRVEWGVYEPAIRRWEAVHGPAPDPLTRLRRLDDGNPAMHRLRRGMDRHRLSALGDGVHVYAARLIGEHLMAIGAGDGD